VNTWYPAASRSLTFGGCGPHVHGPYRIVLHTTEGPTIAGALGAYRSSGNYPHFTVDGNTVEQHCPLEVGSTALKHPSGTPETNRASAIQIEIVGYAAHADQLPTRLLVPLLEWIAAQTGARLEAAAFKAYPSSAGFTNGIRFSDAEWASFNGICGHQHVPNNDHGDPGLISLPGLGSTPQPAPGPQSGPPWGTIAVDGDFGSQTVKALQASLNSTGANPQLAIDGGFGPASKKALQGRLNATNGPVTIDGDVGQQTVKALQRHVGAGVDGAWGSETTSKLQESLRFSRAPSRTGGGTVT
jgi:hypothetical protein